MKAYECTRCDSFGTSGVPESQRCECDDVEDALRADLATEQQALAASQQEVERLRRVIEDAAPMMMTVTAFGADEADKNGLAEMARWYVEQERDYSSFDVWLDAYRDREKRNKEGGVEP